MPDKTGSPLNRLSWLRPFHSFLNSIIEVPTTRWILFNNGKPLIVPSDTFSLAYLTTQDVEPLLGPRPYFGQGKALGDLVSDADPMHDKHLPTESVRHRGPRIVFLGLHESGERDAMSLPGSDFTDPETTVQEMEGTPYFSMDVSDTGLADEELQRLLDNNTTLGQKLIWSTARPVVPWLGAFTAAVFAPARSMVDWNQRNKFCPGCGSPSYSMWGGWKLACSSLLPWAEPTNKQCFTAKGLHNFMHPRTDVVVIMIAIDETCDKILLGRGRKYPEKYYSALAGFIEPGESFEEAVAREMLEEAGAFVWDVRYHSGQPWPYPANLMVGFYARGDSTKPIRIDLDKELFDARWFTRQEIRAVLEHPGGSRRRNGEYQKINVERQNTVQPGSKHADSLRLNASGTTGAQAVKDKDIGTAVVDEPPFKVPSVTLVGGLLIRDWIEGKIHFQPEGQQGVVKGNL